MVVDWIKAQQRTDRTGRWAVTMSKVRRLHQSSCRNDNHTLIIVRHLTKRIRHGACGHF
jgi:hypothetical protein